MKNTLTQMAWAQALQNWRKGVALPYYQSLAQREQYILWFGAVCLPLMLIVFVVVLPLHDAKQQREQSLMVLQKQALKAEALAQALQKKGPIRASKNTMAVVDGTAKKVGLQQFITRMRPQISGAKQQRLLIQMRSAPYSKVVAFLDSLSKHGLSLLSVKIQKDKLPGFVHVQAIVE